MYDQQWLSNATCFSLQLVVTSEHIELIGIDKQRFAALVVLPKTIGIIGRDTRK